MPMANQGLKTVVKELHALRLHYTLFPDILNLHPTQAHTRGTRVCVSTPDPQQRYSTTA